MRADPLTERKPVLIRTAVSEDAAVLADLAARTFRDAFGPDNSPEDLARHLERSYGLAQQSAELADPAITTLLAEVGGTVVGYAQLKTGPPPQSVPAEDPLEIMRFYVDKAWHGQGVAQQLMRVAIDHARHRGARTLWLGVWERNPRAIAFYQKCEFQVTGDKVFCVGNDRQKDLVMTRSL